MSQTEAFPLAWPAGVPRARYRVESLFSQDIHTARKALAHEVDLLGGSQVVITTNFGPLRKDGTGYLADATLKGNDPGCAVYFTRKGIRHCLACDKYLRLWENVYALAKTIEAMRGIERWGSTDMLDRAFQGFAALPAPTVVEAWWDVLGVERHATTTMVEGRYRFLAKEAHPDAGGSHDAMSRLNQAMESFRAERGI